MRSGLYEFYFEIKDSGGLVVLPNWIVYFDSEHLVPPAEWSDSYNPFIVNDIWLEDDEDRFMTIDDILIVTG
jgi:hypothetical protein